MLNQTEEEIVREYRESKFGVPGAHPNIAIEHREAMIAQIKDRLRRFDTRPYITVCGDWT